MMEYTKDSVRYEDNGEEVEKEGSFDFAGLVRILALNWYWFLISIIICVAAARLYIRYVDPVYSVFARLYIKSSRSGSRNYETIIKGSGTGYVDYGLVDEQQILRSSTVASQVVKDLKLYTSYSIDGNFKTHELYKNEPIIVDLDPSHLEVLNSPIKMEITREGDNYHVTGTYRVPVDDIYSKGPYLIDKTFSEFPATITTGAGTITFNENTSYGSLKLEEGRTLTVSILSPLNAAYRYMGAVTINASGESSNMVDMRIEDTNIQRGKDYLKQLVICYNKQANDNKNEISKRTEEFINERIAKVSAELGSTDSEIENFKRSNQLVTLNVNARSSEGKVSEYEQQLAASNTQATLLDNISDIIDSSNGSYELLPANIGIDDGTSSALISAYNQKVLERNQLLRTASANNPSVTAITAQLEDMKGSIRLALNQARREADIRRDAIVSQLNQYSYELAKTPEQERVLTQIGRQQSIKTNLYLTLLQKREENSIDLAATDYRSNLIEIPQYAGIVSPRSTTIQIVAVVLGICIPALILYLMQFLRYRIEGRSDVQKLTSLPVIGEVAVASDGSKTTGDIVVHENQNNTMEEVFRSIRTNLQFKLRQGQKVIMFTSSISGEGKTFCAANLAISFALLGKRVILCGMDIRKPRLAELFEINNHHNGITNLLTLDKPSWDDISKEILPSGIHDNFDLLMAGPIPPNPSELVNRESLDEVFNQLREHYDYIIMDTAPIDLVVDTLQTARVADTTVFICRADYTPKKCFEYINEVVEEKKILNASVVINGIDMTKRKHKYTYGYGYYGKIGAYYGRTNYGGHYGGYGYYGGYGKNSYSKEDDKSVKQ